MNTEHKNYDQHIMLHPRAIRIVLNDFVNNYLTGIDLYLALVVIKHALK